MPKPGRRGHSPSNELTYFTGRDDHRAVFHRALNSPTEPPVLVFYGIGGAGKSWLLKKLRDEVPKEIPTAFLDFDTQAGGQRFTLDPAQHLYEIRQQLGQASPRFDLAYAMRLFKQGGASEPGFRGHGAVSTALEIAAEAAQLSVSWVPGVNVTVNKLSKTLARKIKGTKLEEFLAHQSGNDFLLELRRLTTQEIDQSLTQFLADDLNESLTPSLKNAVRAVLFLDTFEALTAGLQNPEHRRFREQWIQDIAASFDHTAIVIAGQNELTWAEADPRWADLVHLGQYSIGGLSEPDAHQYLNKCKITNPSLQDAILGTSRDQDDHGSHHCFSLGLCVDIVHAARRSRGVDPDPDLLRLNPQDWEALARRFLKSLASNEERRWIARLAITPRFDETAARAAFSSGHSAAQDAEWETLPDYSFVQCIANSPGWQSIRSQMRLALANQPSEQNAVRHDHQWWRAHWNSRSFALVDDAAGLAWFHGFSLDPAAELQSWESLAESARSSVPKRMQEHLQLIMWWEPVGLLDSPFTSEPIANSAISIAVELISATLGDRAANLSKAIECYEAALRVYTESDFPQSWATTQNNLGLAWGNLPTGDRAANLSKAIECYEAALRVNTESDFPRDWAITQNDLGNAWWNLPTGDRAANLSKAIECYEAALRVFTESDFPQAWATTQNNLGNAWSSSAKGDRAANLSKAIECYEAALRVFTEGDFPQAWAMTQNNLVAAWSSLPTGDRAAYLAKAIECFEAALRVYTEGDFPQHWAMMQNNLGAAWSSLPTGDQAANLTKAIECYEAALRVNTESDFPQAWATTQNNLGLVWGNLPTGDRAANLSKAIECYEAALRVNTESDFPRDWAITQNDLGNAWWNLPTGDRAANLTKAIECYEAALRVNTESDFPQAWATTQNNLGAAWSSLPTEDQAANLSKAIECYEAALRVNTESDFPRDWAITQNNLGAAWSSLPTEDQAENLSKAIECYEAALRVYTESDFPQHWATTLNNLGLAWGNLPTGDRAANLLKAIECYEAALRVYTESDFPRDWAIAQNNLDQARQDLAASYRIGPGH